MMVKWTWRYCVILLSLPISAAHAQVSSSDVKMTNRHLGSALAGDAVSQLYMGALHSAGIGIGQSQAEAFYWFSQAAKQGQSRAQVVVSELYTLGRGVTKNSATAYYWAYLAAASDDPNSRSDAKGLLNLLSARMSTDEFAEAAKLIASSPLAAPPSTVGPPVRPGSEFDRLDAAIRQNPRNGNAYYRRGQARALRSQYALANEDFDMAIQLNSSDAEAFNNRCWGRAALGRLQEALADCDRALQLRPNYADALDSRGLVNLKFGQNDRAIADYTAALQLKPSRASALYGRGIAKLRKGSIAAGNMDIEAAKRIDPDVGRQFSRVLGQTELATRGTPPSW
jgi:tetratricopeptide (TPR) repeat protein